MALIIVKIIFLFLSSVTGYIMVQNLSADPTPMQSFQGAALGLAVPAVIFALEVILRKYFLDAVAGIMFGLTAGFILSYIILQSANLIMPNNDNLKNLQIPIILVVCYITVAIVLQTKDKFKIIIPYLDFRSDSKIADFLILDSSAIIDSRVFKLLKMNLFPQKLIIPQFVLEELQALSDSQDRLKRSKGKKALATVQQIRGDMAFSVEIHADRMDSMEGVDAKLVALAQKVNGRIVTTDGNLVRVAQIDRVQALNMHEIATAFKTELIVGEHFEIELVKPGEKGKDQGVGFLEDGTMVVVQEALDKVGQTLEVEITNSVQTASGKMIFAKMV